MSREESWVVSKGLLQMTLGWKLECFISCKVVFIEYLKVYWFHY